MHSEEKKSTFSFVTCSSSFCGFNVHLLVQNPDGFSACTASKPVIELLLKSVLKQLPIIERKLRFRTWYMHSRTFKPKARVEENVFAIVSRKVYTHVCLLHPRHSLFFCLSVGERKVRLFVALSSFTSDNFYTAISLSNRLGLEIPESEKSWKCRVEFLCRICGQLVEPVLEATCQTCFSVHPLWYCLELSIVTLCSCRTRIQP